MQEVLQALRSLLQPKSFGQSLAVGRQFPRMSQVLVMLLLLAQDEFAQTMPSGYRQAPVVASQPMLLQMGLEPSMQVV